MSKTGFQFGDSGLELLDATSVIAIGLFGDEAQVARLVAFVHVDAIQLQTRFVPAVQRDQIGEKTPTFRLPLGPYVDASAPVVGVSIVVWIPAAVDARRDSVEQPPAVRVVRDDVRVTPVFLLGASGFPLCALVAACRLAASQIRFQDRHVVSACALDENRTDPAAGTSTEADHGKLAEAVANAWLRVLSHVASSPAGVQVSFVLIK